jgi:hypothetical protein
MVRKLTVLLVLCLGAQLVIAAAPEDFELHAERGGDGTEITVWGKWTVDGVQGWSWGLRHDPAEASIAGCVGMYTDCTFDACTDVVCPEDMLTPGPADEAADFNSLNVYDEGVTQGIVLSLLQKWGLDQTERFEMAKMTYTVAAADGCADLNFVQDLGTPSIDTVYVHQGLSIEPAVQDTSATAKGSVGTDCEGGGPTCPAAFKLSLAKVGDDQVAVILDTTGPDTEPGVSAFSFGLAIESADLVGVNFAAGQAFTDLNHDPAAEGFWGVEAVEGGITLGAVVDLQPNAQDEFVSLPRCAEGLQIAVASFRCKAGVDGPVTSNISLVGDLGTPPVPLIVDVDGDSFDPEAGEPVSVTVTCEPIAGEPFIRGDANQDGRWTVSDGVAIAKAVFNLGSKLALITACEDSADVDDDGDRDVEDALYLLRYLFDGGPAVPAPIGACGPDETPDSLPDCTAFACP